MEERPYQSDVINRVFRKIGEQTILVAPTGSGKTFMGCRIVEMLNCQTLWMVHRKELVEQASRRLLNSGIHPGVIMSGIDPSPTLKVQVASIQTLARRTPPEGIQLIVIDECHHVTSKTYEKILEYYPNAWILGLTATPFRLDSRGLGVVFKTIVQAATTKDLIHKGYLIEPTVYAGKVLPDMQGCRMQAGDFNKKDMLTRIFQEGLVGDIVKNWFSKASGLKTLCFASSVDHSQAIVDLFTSYGVKAEHIDAKTPKKEREKILERFTSGQTRILSNVEIVTEGYDLPDIEAEIIARPTQSLAMHLQILGRGMRPADGKEKFIVLDHAGNHHRHGPATRDIKYNLSSNKKMAAEPTGLKICPSCYLMVTTRAARCPVCDYVFTVRDRDLKAVAGNLELFDDSTFQYQAMYIDDQEETRVNCNYKFRWTWHRFMDRFGTDDCPIIIYPDGHDWPGHLINPDKATMEEKTCFFNNLETIRIEARRKTGWTSHKYKNAFGVWPKDVMNDEQRMIRSDR